MKERLFLVGLIILSCPIFSFSQGSQINSSLERVASISGPTILIPHSELSKLIDKTKASNTRLDKALSMDIASQLGRDNVVLSLRKEANSNTSYSSDLDRMFHSYTKRREENEVGMVLLKGTNKLVKLSLLCGSSNLKIPLLCDAVETGLAKVESMAKREMDEDIRKILKTGLKKVLKKAGSEEVQKIRGMKTSQEVVNAMKPYEDIVQNLFDNISVTSPDDQQIVLSAMLKAITQELSTGFRDVDTSIELTGNQLKETNKNVAALSRTFIAFAESNNRRLDSIVRVQNDIKDQLVEMNDKIGKTEEGVEFLQQYFFGQMSPAEQINALKLNQVPGLSEDKKAILIDQIELYKKQQDLNNSIQGFLNGANEVVSIAENFGLDGKVLKKLSDAVVFGTSVFNAYTSLQTGNFLGAVSAVSNIFGFSGPDIASQRHNEIMNALTTVYEQIGVVDRKIDTLLRGQREILKNQQVIFNGIVSLSKQIDQNQNEIRDELKSLHIDITYQGQLIRNYVNTQYTNCYRMIVDDVTNNHPDTIISTARNLFPSYESLKNYCRKWASSDDIRQSFSIISQVRKYDLTFDSPIFNLNSSKDPENYQWVSEFINKVHKPSNELLTSDNSMMGVTLGNKQSSLFLPVLTIDALSEKLDNIKAHNIDITSRYVSTMYPGAFEANLNMPLWQEAVERHVNFILDLHYYRMVIDPTVSKPYPREDLISEAVNTAGYEDLKNGLALIDFAIAQQTLYSGDALLPVLENIINDNDTLNRAKKTKATELLNSNSVLATNFITYVLRKEIQANSKFSTYGSSYSSQDEFLMKLNFKKDWKIKWSDSSFVLDAIVIPKGWSINLGSKYYSLPSAEQLKEGKLMLPTNIRRLLDLKTRILDEIDSYEIYKKLTPSERRNFNLFTLSTLQ